MTRNISPFRDGRSGPSQSIVCCRSSAMSVRFGIVPDLPSDRNIVLVDRVRSAWKWNWHQTGKRCGVSRYVCVPTLRRCPSRDKIEGNNPNFVRSTMTANPSHPSSYLQRGRDRDEDDEDTNVVTTVIYVLLLSLVRLHVVLFSDLSSILRSQIPVWSLWVRGLSDRTKDPVPLCSCHGSCWCSLFDPTRVVLLLWRILLTPGRKQAWYSRSTMLSSSTILV